MKKIFLIIKKICTKIVDFWTSLLLGIIYFLIILPYKLVFLILKIDKIKPDSFTFWKSYPKHKKTIDDLRRQF